ncbi:hypothetical protein [Bdellovibrio bacteriovorus]|uniref:hypothetical protein n=1 Tax=Bdellovibrio bacteriovorus TaxID=959 RepID=UPI0035A59ADF
MKNSIRLVTCLFFVLLSFCTTQEGTIKKLALELGEKKFQEQLKIEADDSIKQSEWLNKSYQEFMLKKSEVEVVEVKFLTETKATAVVVVNTYPPSLRMTLARIAGGMDPGRSRSFNFAEAVNGIGKQIGKTPETLEHPLIMYKFNKTSAGTWVVEF